MLKAAADSEKWKVAIGDKEMNGPEFGVAVMKVLKNINDDAILRYTLAAAYQVISADKDKVNWFAVGGSIDALALSRLAMNSHEQTICFFAVNLLAYFVDSGLVSDGISSSFLSWLVNETRAKGNPKLLAVLSALMTILSNKKLRPVIVKGEGLQALALLLKNPLKPQVAYQVLFCLWCLSYLPETANDFTRGGTDAIAGIVKVLNDASKEKIIRVGINTLKNLIGKAECNQDMIENKMMKFLTTLAARTFTDPEIKEDIDALMEGLKKDYSVLSSFDKYAKEITSGKLEWGPVHTDEFWKDNVTKMEKDDFKLIRCLVSLLDQKNTSQQIAIACFDIGEFIRFYPNGKKIVQSFGAKSLIMAHLDSKDKEIKNQALLCCSKMMVSNWEFIDAK